MQAKPFINSWKARTRTKRDRTGKFVRRYHRCRVPGCSAAHHGKGFCKCHLQAFERDRIDAEGRLVRLRCQRCHELYIPAHGNQNQAFCPECAQQRARERKLEAQQARRKKNNRPPKAKRCLRCGISFRPFHTTDKFHSKPCRLAYRKPEMQEYHREYYGQHSDKAKDRGTKQRDALQRRVSDEKLKHLRHPENRRESLEEGVCLWCGWIGNDLHQHLRHCPGDRFIATAQTLRRQSPSEYGQRWGLLLPLISPKQRKAYSQKQRRIWTSFELRARMARNRWGKGTRPRLGTRKILNSEMLENVANNPGLSLTERSTLLGMSRVGVYKRVGKFGDVGALRTLQLEFVRLACNAQLRKWIASQPENFPAEELLQFCIDHLDRGALKESDFASFALHLEPELRERPQWIADIAAEIAGHKPARTSFRLGNRVLQRMHAGKRGKVVSKEKSVSQRTIEKGDFCAQVQGEMRKIRNLSRSGRTIVEIQLAHPDFVVWKVRDTLPEEDRDHFNHPSRWEAVIGYARTILGKHYDAAPVTVRDWVKAYRAELRKSRRRRTRLSKSLPFTPFFLEFHSIRTPKTKS